MSKKASNSNAFSLLEIPVKKGPNRKSSARKKNTNASSQVNPKSLQQKSSKTTGAPKKNSNASGQVNPKSDKPNSPRNKTKSAMGQQLSAESLSTVVPFAETKSSPCSVLATVANDSYLLTFDREADRSTTVLEAAQRFAELYESRKKKPLMRYSTGHPMISRVKLVTSGKSQKSYYRDQADGFQIEDLDQSLWVVYDSQKQNALEIEVMEVPPPVAPVLDPNELARQLRDRLETEYGVKVSRRSVDTPMGTTVEVEGAVVFSAETKENFLKIGLISHRAYNQADPPFVSFCGFSDFWDRMSGNTSRNATEAPWVVATLLHAYLDARQDEHQKATLQSLLEQKLFAFDYVAKILSPGTQVCLDGHRGSLHCAQGGVVTSIKFIQGDFATNPSFQVTVSSVCTDGVIYAEHSDVVSIPYFDGILSYSAMKVRPLQEEDKAYLATRGQFWVRSLARGPRHVLSLGSLPAYFHLRHGSMEHSLYDANNRVVVDEEWWRKENFKGMIDLSVRNQNPRVGRIRLEVDGDPSSELHPDDYWRTPAFVHAVSLKDRSHGWGRYWVADLREIVYSDHVWDELVLHPDLKKLLRALVLRKNQSSSTFMPHQGVGRLILLHGAPGTGKTLTAQCVAEVNHLPLLSLTPGDFGVEAVKFESKLVRWLETSYRWNAVLLLDEADIYVEERMNSDTVRNAIVALMLKHLENHRGVVILTTNRVRSFDPALLSRCQLKIEYLPHTKENRVTIWRSELSRQRSVRVDAISDSEIQTLAEFQSNGREIRNAVNSAVALCDPIANQLSYQQLLTAAQCVLSRKLTSQ